MSPSEKKGSSRLFWCCSLIVSLLSMTFGADGQSRIELSPFCEGQSKIIYFVDQIPGQIRSFDTNTEDYAGAPVISAITNKPYTMSFAIPIKGSPNKFVCGLSGYIGMVEWDGKSSTPINPTFVNEIVTSPNLVNGGATDEKGLLYVVTPADNSQYGSIIPVDAKGRLLGALNFPGLRDNIAFHGNKFYFTDWVAKVVNEMDYNSQTLTFNNSRVVFDLQKLSLDGTLGGLTIDAQGNLWVSRHSNPVVGFNLKSRKVIYSFNMSMSANSITFCGPSMNLLYAATSSDPSAEQPDIVRMNEFEGGITGVPGVPANFPTLAPA